MPSVVLGDNSGGSGEGMLVGEMDIKRLTNDEIYNRLKDLGAEIGPVESSTRSVYERKLFRLLSGEEVPVANRDVGHNGSRFSENEDDGTDSPGVRRRSQADRRPVPRPNVPAASSVTASTLEVPAASPVTASRSEVTATSPLSISSMDGSFSDTVYFSSKKSPQIPELSLGGVYARRPMYPEGRPSMDSSSSHSSPFVQFVGPSQRGMQPSRSSAGVTNGNGVSGVTAAKKNGSLFVTCFEVGMAVFLVVVGYIFYSEIQAYSAAEREFVESNAQNFQG